MDTLPPDPRDKIITPLKVTTREEGAGHADGRKQSFRYYTALVGALVILTAGGLWLFSYLSRNPLPPDALRNPKQVSGVPPETVLSTVPASTQPPEGPAQTAGGDKEAAEQKLADFLKINKELDEKGVAEWGGEEYQRLLQLSKEADAALMREEFDAAAAGYAQAAETALSLQASIPDLLRDILDQGQRSLAQGDGTEAERLFKLALTIDSVNPAALRNLERAKNCEKVAQLIQSAARHEAGNSLSSAHADYQEAVRLDPESEEARAGLARVDGLIASRQFDELMAGGITALHANDYGRARQLLLKARSIKPDSPAVRDALAQADSALKRVRIDELRASAANAERAEEWNQALADYQSVLSLDGSVQFALQGKERALKRKEAEAAIQSYLAQPGLLETDQSLNRAVALLDQARQMEPRGPRISRLIQELDALVAAARTTITVTIESDGFTEVAVYKVDKLGRFQSRELSLRPGTYTITGTRAGYKDVRHSLSVRPGSTALRLTVTCTEKI
jgi:hypothetical protein